MRLKNSKLFLILILLIQLILLLYFGNLKKGMHFDECFSYFNTNNSVGRMAYDRSFVSSEDILKDFYVKDGEQFNYKYVVELQSYDVHPPVFYLLLHTVCSFMPYKFSMWQGVGLNIFYALLTTIFLYLIIKRIIDNDKVALVITLLTAINTGVCCNVMFIRMYCLMTLFITIAIYLHIIMSEYNCMNELSFKIIIANSLLAYVGFLTHYFYLLFIFFLEFFFWIFKLFDIKNNYKGFIKYAACMLLAGILGVLSFPSCLGHVNSGYRGQEVKSYLFDLSDFKVRFSFFNELINKYVFNKSMIILLLIIILLFVFAYYKAQKERPALNKLYIFVECMFLPVVGYYVVSVKCSLMGDEAMMRYQLPIYGLIYTLVLLMLYALIKYVFNNKINKYIIYIVGLILLVINVFGLINKNVFYLYQEQEYMDKMASNYKNETCIYIYNNEEQKYLLWNDAMQLAQYEDVYFINIDNKEKINENKINDASKLVVYISNLGEHEDISEYTDLIYDNNKNVNEYNKIYDAVYATAYEFY